MTQFCASIVNKKSPARMNSARVISKRCLSISLDTQIPGRIQDKVRRALAYHAHGGMGVAPRNDRDDGGVRDPYTLDPAHRHPPITHPQTAFPHLRSPPRL